MQAIFTRFQIMLTESSTNALSNVVDLLPEILFALVAVFVGWIAAVIAHVVTVHVLGFFAIDKLAGKTPLDSMLRSIGIRRTISHILASLVFWLVILITLVVTADILKMQQVSEGLAVIMRFVPQLIAAILIVIVGMLFAKFLQMLLEQTMGKMEIGYRKFAGKAIQCIVLIFVFAAAVDQLGFNLDYVVSNLVTIASVVLLMLGLGIAFGARTVLDNALASHQLRRDLPSGSILEIEGKKGTVTGFTLTSVRLRSEGKTFVVPATHFFTSTYEVLPHGN